MCILFFAGSSLLFGTPSMRVQTISKEVEVSLQQSFIESLKNRYKTIGLYKDESGTFQQKPFFTTAVIKEIMQVRERIKNPPAHLSHYKGEELALQTPDGHTIHALYFNRNSSKLLVCAPGFGFFKEVMVPFVDLYPEYDIVIMDQRGHGLEAQANSITDRFAHSIFGIVPSLITYGKKEVYDALNLVTTLHSRTGNRYNQVIGFGHCYSSLIFVRAARKFPQLFDRLIVDGTVPSLKKVFSRMQDNPFMLANLRVGGIGPARLQSSELFYSMMTKVHRQLFDAAYTSSLKNRKNLSELTIPIMFIHGHADIMVSDAEFEKLWQATASPEKVALLTDNRHLINHLKDKELYHYATTRFIESGGNANPASFLDNSTE